jgi:predicted Zn-dependent protease
VIGYEPDTDVVVLRSGTRRRHLERRDVFLHTWEAGGRWAAVVTRPGEPPATATGAGFIRALAAAERSLPAADIEQAQAAALARWPTDPLVLLANGNQAYANGQLPAAIAHYRALLGQEPGNVAGRNNLANALLDAGCTRAALAEASRADADVPPDSPLEAPVRDTLAKVRSAADAAAGSNDGSVCAAE